jgi:hypothetical protein
MQKVQFFKINKLFGTCVCRSHPDTIIYLGFRVYHYILERANRIWQIATHTEPYTIPQRIETALEHVIFQIQCPGNRALRGVMIRVGQYGGMPSTILTLLICRV